MGIWRSHYYLQEIIQLLEDGKVIRAWALAIQVSKALVQVAIEQGSWKTATSLVPVTDPLQGEEFGGDEWELHVIQGHQRAVQELKGNTRLNPPPPGDPEVKGGGKRDKNKNQERKD